MYRLLYEDHGYRRPVCSWNAADVMKEDGMLQHGTVIDVEPGGLIVDFGCDGQRRQLVKYGEAFAYNHVYYSAEELRPGYAVDVLLRHDPQSPWVWSPATLVTADVAYKQRGMLVLVDVHLGGVVRREVVGWQQIRPLICPFELQSRVLEQGTFVVTSIPSLNPDVAAMLPTHSPIWNVFCQQLYSCGSVSPTSVSSSEMLLLQRSAGSLSQSDLENIVREVRGNVDTRIRPGVIWVEKGWRCCLPLPCASTEAENSPDRTERILQNVHHLVLAEVLGYLDTMERAVQRRVCRLFDELFRGTSSIEIRMTRRQCSTCSVSALGCCCGCSRYHLYYPWMAPLLKCFTPRTRLIVLANAGHWQCTLAHILRTVGVCVLLGHGAAGQVSVVAGQSDLGKLDGAFWDDINSLVASTAGGWCDKLLLKQCTMSRTLPDLCFSGQLRGSTLQQNLCELVESQLPAVDVQQISQWVAKTVHGHIMDRIFIQMELQEFVSPDPRPSNAYAGHEWTEDNVTSVDVTKLSRIAQYALGRYHSPKSF